MLRKEVTFRELKFTLKAEEAGVAPEIFGYSGHSIAMKKYRWTLATYIEDMGHPFSGTLKNSIGTLVEKLHTIGILHGDLHPNNIVLNSEEDVKLIDFGSSYHVEEIDDEVLGTLSKFWGEEVKTVDEALAYEFTMYQY